MRNVVKKRKSAHCFQWLRDARQEMSREMAGMTPEERSSYIHIGAEKALGELPKLSPEMAKKERDRFLHPTVSVAKK